MADSAETAVAAAAVAATYDDAVDEIAADVDMLTSFGGAGHEHLADFDSPKDSAAPDDYRKKPTDGGVVPEAVCKFLQYLQRQIREKNVAEVQSLYENSFSRLTDKFYPKSAWPSAEEVEKIVEPDESGVFMVLYRELYYRHVYSKLQPTVEQRVDSFDNYCNLFNYLLEVDEEGPADLELPNQWLWEIVDEFLYQYESFCRFRVRVRADDSVTLAKLRAAPSDLWSAETILDLLEQLISVSQIRERAPTGPAAAKMTYKMLGHFCVAGVMRIYVSMGNFHSTLKALDGIELNRKGVFTRVTACYVATYYHLGFAYAMSGRYSDAIKALTHILLYIARTKQYHTRSYQYDQILKKSDQMYAMLAICVTLSPVRIDEQLHTTLREKHGDQLNRMQRHEDGRRAIFEELFVFASPRFLDVAANAGAAPDSTMRHVTRVFLSQIQPRLSTPVVRSYLKLYQTLPMAKLATLLDLPHNADAVPTVKRELLCYKHNNYQKRSQGGNNNNSSSNTTNNNADLAQDGGDLDFYIDGAAEMVHVAERKIGRRFGEYFIRRINKLDDSTAQLTRVAAVQ